MWLIKLVRVLVTSFDKPTILVTVWLYHNLDSSMLKYEDSLN